jgi:hypothetical protein
MPATPKTRTIGARIVVQELRRQALDVERIANEAGLEMREINRQEGWIPFLKHAALVEIAAHETGDDFFGLHIAEQVDPRDLGALGYIGLSSQTLGDALLNLERYLATITEAFRIELSIEDDFAYVRTSSSPRARLPRPECSSCTRLTAMRKSTHRSWDAR